MATVHKRGGRWRAQVRRDGRSISQTFGGKLDAQRWARQMETDFDRARATPAGLRVTFDTLVETYLEGMRGKPMGTTKQWTIGRLRQFFARVRLEELTFACAPSQTVLPKRLQETEAFGSGHKGPHAPSAFLTVIFFATSALLARHRRVDETPGQCPGVVVCSEDCDGGVHCRLPSL